jgi:hypothetical protein
MASDQKWTPIGEPFRGPHGKTTVLCACACGRTTKAVLLTHLKMGSSRQCDLCRHEMYRRNHGFNYTRGVNYARPNATPRTRP